MAKFTREDMKARFHEVSAEIEAIETQTAPLRQAYDDIRNASRAAEAEAADKFKKIEQDGKLAELKDERKLIIKALGGQTGERVDAESAGKKSGGEAVPAPAQG